MPADIMMEEEAAAVAMEDDDPVSIKNVEDLDNKSQRRSQGQKTYTLTNLLLKHLFNNFAFLYAS